MARGPLSAADLAPYPRDGYVLARGLFDAREIVRPAARREGGQGASTTTRSAAPTARAASFASPSGTTPATGSTACSPAAGRWWTPASCSSSDEVYHYHSKMIMKEARVGGAWAWHQDYGYWYQNGVLAPDLVSVFIAVDPATRENGCLQVLQGSHRCGRVDHVLTGDQAGADPERVAEIAKRLPLVHVEMEPGDALFFHPNLLHRSDQNRSENPRWSLICCYNARRNDPYKESHHPRYTPLVKVEDSAILDAAQKRFAEAGDVGWLDPGRDASARGLDKERR